MITVVLCDDQALIRDGLRMILDAQADIEVVAEAADGAEAVELVRSLQPAVVLMDIRMPGTDGIEATRRVLATPGNTSRVLVLTTFNEEEYLSAALAAGAVGFLLKSCPGQELVDAVRTTAAGRPALAPEVAQRLVDHYVRTATAPAPERLAAANLTPREVEVLTLVGRGRTNAELAAELFLSDATVKTHINRIFTKLGITDRANAVVFAYECGLIRPGGP